MLASFPVAEWRATFAGGDEEAGEFLEGFSLDGAITAAYGQMWGR